MSATEPAPEDEERLKAALWYAIGAIVDEESLRLNVNATPQFIGALTELVWSHIGNVAKDLENFAKHANRTTIQTSDVLLLARRNEGLEALLRGYVDKLQSGGTAGRGTVKGKGKGKAVVRAGRR